MQNLFPKYKGDISAEPKIYLLFNQQSVVVSTLLRFQFTSHLWVFRCLFNHRHLGALCLFRMEPAFTPKVDSDGNSRNKFKNTVLKIVLKVIKYCFP